MHLVYQTTPLTDGALQCAIDIINEHTGDKYRLEATRTRREDTFEVHMDEALQTQLYQLACKTAPHAKRDGDVFIRHASSPGHEPLFLVPAGPSPYSLDAVLAFFGKTLR